MKFLLRKSYLETIKNSVGSKIFRNLYFEINRETKDILENGVLSCAVFVSWILKNFDLIKDGHATVDGIIKDLKKSGWQKIRKPRIGAILIWEKQKYDSGLHKHIGFYIGDEKAISNSYKLKIPIAHHWTFGQKNAKPSSRISESGSAAKKSRRESEISLLGEPVRKVEEIWWHKKLN